MPAARAGTAQPGPEKSVPTTNLFYHRQLRYFHFMLAQPDQGGAFDIITSCGPGGGFEARRRFCREYEPMGRAKSAGGLMEILAFRFAADTVSFEKFGRLVSRYERKTGKGIDEELKVGVALANSEDETLRTHFLWIQKRLTTYSIMREEIADLHRARDAIANRPMPMQFDAVFSKGRQEGSR